MEVIYECICRTCAFSLRLKKMAMRLFCTLEEPKRVKPEESCPSWRPKIINPEEPNA